MNHSESIANIAKALVSFQAEIKNPANTADNPFFKSKYAPLNEILNYVRPVLSKHGLAVVQSPGGDGDVTTITTLLMHTSGEWIETDPLGLKAEKQTAQGTGSAVTYGRRYSLSAALGISSEDDDDGNQQGRSVRPQA
ncbi:ERF family protein, partial [Candidatus Darwinibacter acetoxidans]